MVRNKWLIVGGLVIGVVAGLGIWKRQDILARYAVYQLTNSADWEKYISDCANIPDAAVPHLIGLLDRDVTCGRAEAALSACLAAWPTDDARRANLWTQLATKFQKLEPAGQLAVINLVGEEYPLSEAAQSLVRAGLGGTASETRVRAVGLALRPESQLVEAVKPLLDDNAPEVRRAAMLAVGPARELISDEELLNWLHDPDAEVRRLCEAVLRSRGLRASDVRLGRLLTSKLPGERLQVLNWLTQDDELDLSLWLVRLSQDPLPAMRTGAIRLAVERSVDIADRIEQMAQNDPDGTVRQVAQFWLNRRTQGGPVRTVLPEIVPAAYQP